MGCDFIIKGHICHTPSKDVLDIHENAFAVCTGGICRGVFEEIPAQFAGLDVIDCTGRLVIPGMVDLHIHAPQYAFCGTGMDYELLEWLDKTTFPEESRYGDPEYARKAYTIFVEKMRKSATTRAVVFGTIHREGTLILMDLLEKAGLVGFVGKVNMNRNSPPALTEPDAALAADETRRFIKDAAKRGYSRIKPIITPRFVPSCTAELLEALGQLRQEYDLPVQSHLSENPGEVELVRELEPEAAFYGDVYDMHGLFGRGGNTVMAHCVYSTPEEVRRMLDNGVWVAHCPSSNMNLLSGIAPVRRYMDLGMRIGLGTDVAAGTSASMFSVVTEAIQVSKLYWRLVDQGARALTFPESFFLATKGGGAFFGKAGSFEEGYAFDALVLDDAIEPYPGPLSVRDRLERAFYLGLDRNGIVMKFAAGEKIFERGDITCMRDRA